jgi:crotonobetainyl-CoA:carnitine CoA-transferase CaiB-like acyl-CoA transferase
MTVPLGTGSTMLPLTKLRILDLSRVLAGPWCAQTLADLGADVIKVERPERGDDARAFTPFLHDEEDATFAESSYFLCANRGKRSITVDLASKVGQDKLRKLAATADVLIENYKVGTLSRYGLDYQTLSKTNPRLIYCSITGFGQSGPYAERAAYDTIIQAMGGLMSFTGHADDQPGGGPMKVGVPLVDIMTGIYASTGVLAALHERASSGLGQHIDVALLDVCIASLCTVSSSYLVSGVLPQRNGNLHFNSAPSDLYPCADGNVILNIGNDQQFVRFCKVTGLDDMIADARFATNTTRLLHRAELEGRVREMFAANSVQDVVARLAAVSVPCAAVNDLIQVFEDPQVRARGVLTNVPHEELGSIPTIANPIRLSRTPIQYRSSAPLLGDWDNAVDAALATGDGWRAA